MTWGMMKRAWISTLGEPVWWLQMGHSPYCQFFPPRDHNDRSSMLANPCYRYFLPTVRVAWEISHLYDHYSLWSALKDKIHKFLLQKPVISQ